MHSNENFEDLIYVIKDGVMILYQTFVAFPLAKIGASSRTTPY